MLMLKFIFITSVIESFFNLVLILCVLITVAYTTLAERKLMGAIQRRFGPNITGFFGLLQPIADGLKLLIKEIIIPKKANTFLFIFSPFLVFFLSLYLWFFLPWSHQVLLDNSFGLLYLLIISIFEIYGIIFAGWSSNSKYALLGGLRSSAQMISYEISLSFIFLSIILISGSFNLSDILLYQINSSQWLVGPLLPLSVIFLISMLAETNRAPFDLPEAEAEIVAGYNVEYSGFLFALFFLGEYSNMLFLSSLFTLLFLGGGAFFLFSVFSVFYCLLFAVKSICILFFFIWVRATLPRFRYDQLMELGWKTFLPFTFAYFLSLMVVFYLAQAFPLNILNF